MVSTTPANATAVPVGQTISAALDKDMDAATLTTASFYVKKSGGAALPARTVSLQCCTRTAILDPAADLSPGLPIPGDAHHCGEERRRKALAGAPVNWSFATAASPPPPTIHFTDVPPGHPYHDAIADLATRGIISGYGGTERAPSSAPATW